MMPARSAAARVASRTPRALGTPRHGLVQRRLQSTSSSSASSSSSSQSHIVSGVAGGVAGAALLYGLYSFTPSGRVASKLNRAAREAESKYQQAASTLRDKAPSTDEAVDRVRQFCYAYVAWVPGGRQYVDAAFRDLDALRTSHGEDVDRIVATAYRRFQEIARGGSGLLSLEGAGRAYDALADMGRDLARVAGSAADELLENHPQLKKQIGGPIGQLKEMGEAYGPEAKRMVDETWDELAEVARGGFSADNVSRIKRLVEDKTEKLKKLGEQAWDKGLEQAKPYLDRNPKVKDLVMSNQDALKRGNVGALFDKVKSAVEGGDLGGLEDYVRKATDKAKSSSSGATQKVASAAASGVGGFSGLSQLLGSGSSTEGGGGGEKLKKNIQLLTEVVNNHSDEGKKLLEETRDDLGKLLEEKAKKAQGIVDSAKN